MVIMILVVGVVSGLTLIEDAEAQRSHPETAVATGAGSGEESTPTANATGAIVADPRPERTPD